MAEDLIDTRRVAAASRIEMRLLSETRRVFEYLPRSSLLMHGCDAIKKWQQSYSFPITAVLAKRTVR